MLHVPQNVTSHLQNVPFALTFPVQLHVGQLLRLHSEAVSPISVLSLVTSDLNCAKFRDIRWRGII